VRPEQPGISTINASSPQPADDVEDSSKERHAQPPDEYALDDPDCDFNGPQTFEFRFQVVFARTTLPRIGLGFSAAVWAFQCFSHAPPIIPPTSPPRLVLGTCSGRIERASSNGWNS